MRLCSFVRSYLAMAYEGLRLSALLIVFLRELCVTDPHEFLGLDIEHPDGTFLPSYAQQRVASCQVLRPAARVETCILL
jgi:hypothetical protein